MTTEPTSKCIDASAHTVEDVVLPTAAYLGLLLSRRLGLLLVQLGETLGVDALGHGARLLEQLQEAVLAQRRYKHASTFER